MKILENRAKCLLCGDVLVSTHRHDFVTCSCGNLCIDGGLDHLSFQIVGDQDSWKPLWVTDPAFDDLMSVGDMLRAWSIGLITDAEISELMHLGDDDDLLEIAKQNRI